MKVNPANIISILIDSYNYEGTVQRTPVNAKEIDLSSDTIKDLINRYAQAGYAEIETEQELLFEYNVDEDKFPSCSPHKPEISVSSSPVEVSESSSNSPDENIHGRCHISIEYKKDAVNFWKSGRKRPLSFKSVQARFKKVKSRAQLYRWEQQISSGGSRLDKLRDIGNVVLEKFVLARNRNVIVHDIDLKRWALQEKQKLSFEGFQASHMWL
nr:PREDICTED: LOW QUALITY PROTEIN: uncharacterized protein LOC105664100 [Megachile rotundata]